MSNVIRLKPKSNANAYAPDPIFFTKDQIKVGTVLMHLGRKDRSAWVVDKIVTYRPNGARHLSDVVTKFSDSVYLRRMNAPKSHAQRHATFGYLSYSAIWRIG